MKENEFRARIELVGIIPGFEWLRSFDQRPTQIGVGK